MSLLSAARHTWLPGSLLAAAALTGAAAHSLSWGKDKAFLNTTVAADQPPAPAGALDPKEFKAFKLIKKEKLTHNTLLYRFELPKGQVAGLNTASCLVTKAVLPDKPDEPPKPVIRPYTPTSAPDAKGYLDLVVKVYPTGKMSKHIDSLKIGDTLEMKGPIPKWPYKPNVKKQIGMVAGGTGITPMLQVIDAIVANPADKTQVSLVYANVSEEDIILKDKLDAITKKHKNIKVHYIVDKASSKSWKGGVGYVTKDVLKANLPPPSDDHIVFVCGPPGMMAAVSGGKNPKDYSQGELQGALKDLGYTSEQVFKF